MRFARDDKAQVMMVFALLLTVLVLFCGLALDAGLLYMTKAKLSSAVDGACLAGMKTLWQGQTTATNIATGVFDANFGSGAPVPTISFPTDTYGNQQVSVTATQNVNTLFMRILPQFATVPVSATAVSTRGKLIMTIVVDRSGSMCGGTNSCQTGVTGDEGGEALQTVVPSFINNFNDTTDEVAMVSFADNSTIDVPIGYNFKSTITSKVGKLTFIGGTFGTGAGSGTVASTTYGPPFSLAGLQNDSVTVNQGQNVVKVIVYFTDGLMNTLQDSFHCGGTSNQTLSILNYGGHDSGSTVTVFDPTSSTTTFGDYSSSGLPYNSSGGICKDSSGNKVTTFPSQQGGTGTLSFTQAHVTSEAIYRAEKTAIALRTETPIPTYIYTIGLGSGITTSAQNLLQQMANDPTYPSNYTSTQPAGEYFYVGDCTTNLSTCESELNQVFQTIAAKVLLRLTQ